MRFEDILEVAALDRGAGVAGQVENVKLLLGFEGADGSTTFTDESPAAHGNGTANGNAQVDTAQFKYGSASLLLDGSGDYVAFNNHADWQFGAGDFTIEAFIRFNARTGNHVIVSFYAAATEISWFFQYAHATTTLRFGYSTDGANTTSVARSWTPSNGVWYHVCVDRSSGTLRMYIDGAMQGVAESVAATFWPSTTALRVGALAVGGNPFNGWIDELRITKGLAQYASDSGFTVPTEAYPRS